MPIPLSSPWISIKGPGQGQSPLKGSLGNGPTAFMKLKPLCSGSAYGISSGSNRRLRVWRFAALVSPTWKGNNNLIWQAVRLLEEESKQRLSFRIYLKKRIPLGAGLGGGSSDAAAILSGINDFLGRPVSAGRLTELAGDLGSDIPFFLTRTNLPGSGTGGDFRTAAGFSGLVVCSGISGVSAGYPMGLPGG